MKIPMLKYIFFIFILFIISCGRVTVKTDHGFGMPDVYEATDGYISVKYYNGSCCCVAKQVLESLAYKANTGALDWKKMKDINFQTQTLLEECEKIKIKEKY